MDNGNSINFQSKSSSSDSWVSHPMVFGNLGHQNAKPPKLPKDLLRQMGISWVNWDLCTAAMFLGGKIT